MNSKRDLKDALYAQVARLAKAVASPKRLELIELLCQSPKTVETLATEADISVKLASAHLKELRASRLVETERQGKHVIYRVASAEVPHIWVLMRTLAEDRLFELQDALRQLSLSHGEWRDEDRAELLRKAQAGEVVMIDVRPGSEYQHAHLPFARSMPLEDLRAHLDLLPRDKPIVAYCRGPFCLMAADAVALLRSRGFTATHLRDGVAEWGIQPPEPAPAR
ncbi:metalloregulator ArsR/SmtB family transcription factor [Paraburkholderia azotifigens]|uniref:ArsR/SmtB family transcription factor n=1 Tax=Paraburkholderia azotifigens TaxID=2057004 RepID=UPI00317DE0CE